MNIPNTARAFARALLKVALDSNQAEAILSDIQCLQADLDSCPELQQFVTSRHASTPSAREETLRLLWADSLHSPTLCALCQMAHWDVLPILPLFLQDFVSLYHQAKGIHLAHVAFATPPTQEALDALHQKLAHRFPNQHIELLPSHQPDLLAGFRLDVDDLSIDASLQGRIRRMMHPNPTP